VELTISYSEKSGHLDLVVESDGALGDPLTVPPDSDGLSVALVRGIAESIEYRQVEGRSRLELVLRRG
jgi:hypothetical protein